MCTVQKSRSINKIEKKHKAYKKVTEIQIDAEELCYMLSEQTQRSLSRWETIQRNERSRKKTKSENRKFQILNLYRIEKKKLKQLLLKLIKFEQF